MQYVSRGLVDALRKFHLSDIICIKGINFFFIERFTLFLLLLFLLSYSPSSHMEYGITEKVFGNLFFGYAFLPSSRETETIVTKQKMDHQIK